MMLGRRVQEYSGLVRQQSLMRRGFCSSRAYTNEHNAHHQPKQQLSLDKANLHKLYLEGRETVTSVVSHLLERAEQEKGDAAWILRLPRDHVLGNAACLDQQFSKDPHGTLARYPLFGLPFAVKDNIDVAGFPTTAACPRYAYTPWESNPAVSSIQKAGAILMGKNNLDQFATGLVGVRSPYGIPTNPFNADYVPGGSSSGGGVVVSSGQVTFSLGTDTAGSGRVPAAFNNVVGLKPTKGLISTRGIVPACRSLDCLAIFALTCDDAWSVLEIAQGFDFEDEYSRQKPARLAAPPSRLRIGVPKQLEFYGPEMDSAAQLYRSALEVIEKDLGAELVEIDYRPFTSVARILYDGPWVAERLSALKDFYAANAEHIFPVTRGILEKGKSYSAVDTFTAMKHLERLRKEAFRVWRDAELTAMVVPTASVTPTIESVEKVPVGYNTVLGYYTNFVNLLDMCAMAVPNGFLPVGMPSGITFISTAFQDELAFSLGRAFHHARGLSMGATGYPLPPVNASHSFSFTGTVEASAAVTAETVQLSVVGAHMSGLQLNYQLTEIGGKLFKTCKTAPVYRFYDITKEGDKIRRPGLVRVKEGGAKKAEGGVAIETEVWAVPVDKLGHFVKNLKAPLTIGLVELEDGSKVHGFICEGFASATSKDISETGGWRNYVKE